MVRMCLRVRDRVHVCLRVAFEGAHVRVCVCVCVCMHVRVCGCGSACEGVHVPMCACVRARIMHV